MNIDEQAIRKILQSNNKRMEISKLVKELLIPEDDWINCKIVHKVLDNMLQNGLIITSDDTTGLNFISSQNGCTVVFKGTEIVLT